jgi:hypothetical protein
MEGPVRLDLKTLLVVNEWIKEAEGPEHEAFYEVADKVTEAINREVELMD